MTLLRSLMELFDTEDQHPTALETPPSSVWVLPSALYLPYLMCTINKFAAGFEHTLSLCRYDLVSWEHTKVMCMFLRCLRFCLGGQLLQRESGLWWDKRHCEVSDSYVDGRGVGRWLYEEDEDGHLFQVSKDIGLEKIIKAYYFSRSAKAWDLKRR